MRFEQLFRAAVKKPVEPVDERPKNVNKQPLLLPVVQPQPLYRHQHAQKKVRVVRPKREQPQFVVPTDDVERRQKVLELNAKVKHQLADEILRLS